MLAALRLHLDEKRILTPLTCACGAGAGSAKELGLLKGKFYSTGECFATSRLAGR